MMMIAVILSLCFLEVSNCYENLSRRPSTVLSLSSRFQTQNATLANDGERGTIYSKCSHTEENQTIAWLQVDLGERYSISNVTMYYRGHRSGGWRPYRLRQFYLDVSNKSANMSTKQRKRCYTDNTTESDLPNNIIEMPCKQTARYVIVETSYDAPEDTSTGAMLEICEIEVYGCETGKYGDNCTSCEGCKTCDINNGSCGKLKYYLRISIKHTSSRK
ncbi:uncharacterized protein LOC128172139 [Crassostrea angulata]|uniref:uncharacterized protein LOC128172139 n=1 Tax=Magallana angulata TaxID=2784310 RepID=UPI0022B0977C|nr:uncharacterized protein LOC128172139 [Crassostrea angulata]